MCICAHIHPNQNHSRKLSQRIIAIRAVVWNLIRLFNTNQRYKKNNKRPKSNERSQPCEFCFLPLRMGFCSGIKIISTNGIMEALIKWRFIMRYFCHSDWCVQLWWKCSFVFIWWRTQAQARWSVSVCACETCTHVQTLCSFVRNVINVIESAVNTRLIMDVLLRLLIDLA